MFASARTLLERVHRIQGHGLDVWCGMIVGFDSDNPSIFRVLPKFLADARIANALIGLLHAIPTTPLYDRLKKEGRLNDGDDSAAFGTNVAPLGMSREELRKGFVEVTREAYTADAYFRRIDALFVDGGFKFAAHQYWRQHRWAWAKSCAEDYIKFLVLGGRLMRSVEDESLRAKYRSQLLRVWRARPFEPQLLFYLRHQDGNALPLYIYYRSAGELRRRPVARSGAVVFTITRPRTLPTSGLIKRRVTYEQYV